MEQVQSCKLQVHFNHLSAHCQTDFRIFSWSLSYGLTLEDFFFLKQLAPVSWIYIHKPIPVILYKTRNIISFLTFSTLGNVLFVYNLHEMSDPFFWEK